MAYSYSGHLLNSLIGGYAGSGGAVASVNGKSGTVVLAASDVGAATATHPHVISDVAGLQSALDNSGSAGSVGGGLPAGGAAKPFLVCGEADRGNGSNCRFLLQPSTSNNQIVDSAAGNAAPCTVELSSFEGQTVSVDESGNIVCPGVYGYGNYAALKIPANSLPTDVLIAEHEWTVEVDFTTTTVSGTQCVFGRADSGRFDLLIVDGVFMHGGISVGNWGPISAGRNLVTYEHYYDTASAGWVLGCYLNGQFRAAGTPQNSGLFRTLDLLVGNAALSNNNGLNGLIHAFRITNGAPHKGASFTPIARPYAASEIAWSAKSVAEVKTMLGITGA